MLLLAFKSFQRQVRSYLVYFLSMILAVAIFYTFSNLTYDDAIILRANQDARLSQVLVVGQLAVTGILLFFMLSSNRFFLRRRSEEIGIYQLFGLRRWKIIGLFISEITVLGVLSLGIGVVIGIVLSKLFSMVLVKAMALSIESSFFISWRSVGLTAATMFFILVIVAIRTTIILQTDATGRQFQQEQLTSRQLQLNWWQKLLGIFSIAALIASYFGAVATNDISNWLANFIEGAGFGANLIVALSIFFLASLGTVCFFIWGIRFLLAVFGHSRRITEQNLRGLLIGNLQARFTRNRRTTAAVVSTMSVAIILISLVFAGFMISLREVYYSDPTDFQIASEEYPELVNIVEANGGQVTGQETLNYKSVGAYISSGLVNEPETAGVELVDVLAISNYQEYQQLNPALPDISLTGADEVVVLDLVQNIFHYLINYDSRIYLNDQALVVKDVLPDRLGYGGMFYGTIVVVVPDEIFYELSGYSYQITAFNTDNQNLEKLAEDVSTQLQNRYTYPISFDLVWNGSAVVGDITEGETGANTVTRLNYSSLYPNWRSTRRQMGLVMYVAVFIGFISLIITGSIITLRQIAEAQSGKENYELLHLLGVPKKRIIQLIYWENGLVFLPLTGIIVLNSFFGIYFLSHYLTFTNFWLPNIFIVFTIAVYFLFYILTVNFYRRVVNI